MGLHPILSLLMIVRGSSGLVVGEVLQLGITLEEGFTEMTSYLGSKKQRRLAVETSQCLHTIMSFISSVSRLM